MKRALVATVLTLGLLAVGGGEAGATRRLPLCSEVPARVLRNWTPSDGQICLAEDDPGWLARQPGHHTSRR